MDLVRTPPSGHVTILVLWSPSLSPQTQGPPALALSSSTGRSPPPPTGACFFPPWLIPFMLPSVYKCLCLGKSKS